MRWNRTNIHSALKKSYIFLPTGATIEQLFSETQPKFSKHSVIIPVDDRRTHDPTMHNYKNLRRMFSHRAKVKPLERCALRSPQKSCVILSVAEDLHFASIFNSRGDLHKRGCLINTFSSDPRMKRVSIGYSFLRLSNVIFLFKNRTRHRDFCASIEDNHKLKAIFRQSYKIILSDR